jgi:Flp pilus assembly protein TadG
MRAHMLRRKILRDLFCFVRGSRGNAAVEFAVVSTVLLPLFLNVVDFTFLIWSKMEVENAAQIGVQAAFHTCASGSLPATTNCASLNSTITTAIHSTSLSTAVAQAAGSPNENYSCVSGTAIQSVGSYSSPPNPFDCSAAGSPSATPGDYITVSVTYNFAPPFSGLSLVPRQTLASSAIQRLQ